MMSYELKIALRYIFSKRTYNFITVITTISIIGITIGVAALIAVLSIFNGFQKITENQIAGFDPHLRISYKDKNISGSDSLENLINIQSLTSTAYVLSGKAIAINNDKLQVFNIMSIDEADIDYLNSVKENILTGMFDISNDAFDKAIIGSRLADRLRVLPGDTLRLFSPEMIERSFISYKIPQPVNVIVWGIFQMNIKDYDHQYGFININAARRLFRTNDFSYFDMRIENPDNAESIKKDLLSQSKEDINISSWIDLNKDLYNIMKFERMASFIIMSIIIVIAVFNILASLTMTVVEKQKDIAILKSFGATEQSLKRIFIFEGTLIGLISTISGVVLGLVFCYGQIEYKWFAIDGNKYIIDAIPIVINYTDILLITIFSLVLSFLATIYPAKRSSDTIITEALKSE